MKNENQVRKVKERLEKLAETSRMINQREIDRNNLDKTQYQSVALAHLYYCKGLYNAYKSLCKELSVPFEPIKWKKITI